MIGNDTPTRPNQIPLPTTSPEFQDAHLAVRWCDVDLEIATVEINGNVVPVRGRGLVRHSGKTAAALRTVPEFLVTLLRMRYDPGIRPNQPIFANSKGDLPGPGQRREVDSQDGQARYLDVVGQDAGALPRGGRLCVAHQPRAAQDGGDHLDEGGFGATQIADVLGHSNPALTQNVYLHRGRPSDAAASALDAALRPHTR
jgi:integrase